MIWKLSGIVGILLVLLVLPVAGGELPYQLAPLNASIAGTGFSGVAQVNNPAIVYWNPAGMGLTDLLQVDFTMASSEVEVPGSWSFTAVTSEREGDKFGLSLIRHVAVKDSLKFKTFQIVTPFSHQFSSGIVPVGFSLKFISERIGTSDWKTGLAFDSGILLVTPTGFNFGLSSQNIFGSNLQSFDNKTWVGASWGGGEMPLMISGQFQAERFNRFFSINWIQEHYGAGMQISVLPELPDLMAGIVRNNDDEWVNLGFIRHRTKSNTSLAYTIVLEPGEWETTAHFLTYSWGLNPAVSGRPSKLSSF